LLGSASHGGILLHKAKVQWSRWGDILEGRGLVGVGDGFGGMVIAIKGHHNTHFLDMLAGRVVEWVSRAAKALTIVSTFAVMTRVGTEVGMGVRRFLGIV
jgi:hypothetical protein